MNLSGNCKVKNNNDLSRLKKNHLKSLILLKMLFDCICCIDSYWMDLYTSLSHLKIFAKNGKNIINSDILKLNIPDMKTNLLSFFQ